MSKEIDYPNGTYIDLDKTDLCIIDEIGGEVSLDTETAIQIAKDILTYYKQ